MSSTQRAIAGVESWLKDNAQRATEALSNLGDRAANAAAGAPEAAQNALDRVGENLNDLLNDVWPGAGNTPGERPPTGFPPQQGGQCPVVYDVTGSGTRTTPTGGEDTIQINNFGTGPFSYQRGGNQSVDSLLLKDANGKNVANIVAVKGQDITMSPIFTRRDGLPDDCGDIAPPDALPGSGGGGGGSPEGDWGDPLDPNDPNSPSPWGVDPPNGGLCFNSGGQLACYGDDGWYSGGNPTPSNRGIPENTPNDPNDPNGCCASTLAGAVNQLGTNSNASNNQLLNIQRDLGRVFAALDLVNSAISGFRAGADLASNQIQQEFLRLILDQVRADSAVLFRLFTLTADNGIILSRNQQDIVNLLLALGQTPDQVDLTPLIREILFQVRTSEANVRADVRATEALTLRAQQEAQTAKEVALRLIEIENTYPSRDIWTDSKFAADKLRVIDSILLQSLRPVIDGQGTIIRSIAAGEFAVLAALAAQTVLFTKEFALLASGLAALGAVLRTGFADIIGRLIQAQVALQQSTSRLLNGQANLARNQQTIINLLSQIRSQLDVIQDLLDILNQGGNPQPLTVYEVACQDNAGELVAVPNNREVPDLEDAIESISLSIQALSLQLLECSSVDNENVPPTLLASGQSAVKDEVSYVQVGQAVRVVELIITGTIPASINTYGTTQSGEVYGKFGSLAVAYPGSAGGDAVDGFHSWVWTRRCLLNVKEPLAPGRSVRVFMKKGLSWALYDTGVRG